MSQTKKIKTAGLTILHYLNDDCWKCVLDYLDLEDVIISERVSRRWQAVVLRYMQTVRVALNYKEWSSTTVTPWPRVRSLELDYEEWPLFERWAKKLGSTVVFAFCSSEEQLDIIRKHCPNVQSLTIARFIAPISLNYKNKSFKRLQKLRFEHCYYFSDHFISRFIADKALQELQILLNEEMTGRFLLDIELTSLKSLQLDGCTALESRYLLLAAARLTELRRLGLSSVPQDIYKQLHLVFKRTVKLEYLLMYNDTFDERGRLFEGVCRLGRLRHLSVGRDATDADVEAVARCCKELRSLELVQCYKISAFGLRMLPCFAARLTSLRVMNSRLFDDNVVAIVTQCPNLTLLDVAWCLSLSRGLAPRVAAARRATNATKPLRFSVFVTDVEKETCDPALLEGIVLDYSQPEDALGWINGM